MPYTVESWDSQELDLRVSPYIVSNAPLNIELEFVEDDGAPPLPWSLPSLFSEYSATLAKAATAGSSSQLILTLANEADSQTRAVWAHAVVADTSRFAELHDADFSDCNRAGVWGNAYSIGVGLSSTWAQSQISDSKNLALWNNGVMSDRRDVISPWIMKPAFRDNIRSTNFFSVDLFGRIYDDSAKILALLNTDGPLTLNLDGSGTPVVSEDETKIRFKFGFVKPRRPSIVHDISMQLTARKASPRDNRRIIPWGAGTSVWNNWNLPYPVEENPIIIDPTDPPIRKIVYLIMNTLSVIDIETNTPLDIQNVTINHDIDSISWKFSGTVYGQATMDLIAPDEDGMKDIRVTINSHEWVFSIEGYKSDEKFPTQKFTVSGVSRTQYMAAPYAPVNSFTNTSNTTAAQACENVLTDTGFTLNWPTLSDEDLPD